MKNRYEDAMNRLDVNKDFKKDVREAVYTYEEKPARRRTVLKTGAVFAVAALLMIIPGLMNLGHSDTLSYTIKADETLYQLQDRELVLNNVDLQQSHTTCIAINSAPDNDDTQVIRYYTTLPFSIYVEGDDIESISYHLEHGYFTKLKETYDFDKLFEIAKSGINVRSEGSTGLFTPKNTDSLADLMQKGFHLEGDPEKTGWELLESGKDIEIPYESQRTMDALYGINPILLYGDLSEEQKEKLKNGDINFMDMDDVLFQALNNMKVDIRINYKNGTSETTSVKFVVDETTFRLNFSSHDR